MSDFLTSLAARALAPPSLRPRTRSRFEPAVAAAAEGVAFAGVAPPRRERGAVAQPVPAAVVDPAHTPPPPVERHSHEETVEREKPAAIAVPERSPSMPAAKSPPRSATVSVDKPARASASPPVVVTRSVPAPPEVVTETIIETRDVILRESPAPASPAARVPLPALRHRHDEQPPRIERPQPSREVRLETSRQRSVRVAAPQPRAEGPAASEPVIHVFIGRVEVRAVTPQPALKPGRAPRTAMSIDDYVARRNAKGRP